MPIQKPVLFIPEQHLRVVRRHSASGRQGTSAPVNLPLRVSHIANRALKSEKPCGTPTRNHHTRERVT